MSTSSLPLVDIAEETSQGGQTGPSATPSSLPSRPLNLRARPRRSGLFTLPTSDEDDDPFGLKARPRMTSSVSSAGSSLRSVETPVSMLVQIDDDSSSGGGGSSVFKKGRDTKEPLENWDLLQKEAQSLAGKLNKTSNITPAKHLNLLDNFSPVANQSPLFSDDANETGLLPEGFLVASSPEASPPKKALAKFMMDSEANSELIQNEMEPESFETQERAQPLIDLGDTENVPPGAKPPLLNTPLAKVKGVTDLLTSSPCHECKCEKKKPPLEEDVREAQPKHFLETSVVENEPNLRTKAVVSKPPMPRITATPSQNSTVPKRRSVMVAPSPSVAGGPPKQTPLKGRRSLLPSTPSSVRQPISFRTTPSIPTNQQSTSRTSTARRSVVGASAATPVMGGRPGAVGSARRPLSTTQNRPTPTLPGSTAKPKIHSSSMQPPTSSNTGTPLKTGNMPMKRRSLISTPSRLATPRQQLFSASSKPPLVPSASKPGLNSAKATPRTGFKGKDLFRSKPGTFSNMKARTPMVATKSFGPAEPVASSATTGTPLRPKRRQSGLPSPVKRF